MFGNTTWAVENARKIMEENGYEVLVFHATGTGGKTMEMLIDSGFIKGVLDITTTEWADEICGGVLSAGNTRLDAAARVGIPQVVTLPVSICAIFGHPKPYQRNTKTACFMSGTPMSP
jgi:uncharacterized protein (UPF0261 family)